jgi:hypothetical protein
VKRIRKGPTNYNWDQFYVQLKWTPKASQLLCFDATDEFKSQLKLYLEESDPELSISDPYYLYVPILRIISESFDESIWGIRDIVRDIEKVLLV